MLGERLRQARIAAGLSLEGLAAKLEQPITRQALSKYETGASQPPPRRLADIAAVLDIRASSLLTESKPDISWVAYRKLAKLSKTRQGRVTAIAAQRLEGEVRLRELFHLEARHKLPGPIEVESLSDCDYAAAAVRMHWNLGDRPVNSLVEFIEEQGVAVVAWQEPWGFDGLSGWANHTPVIVLNEAVPPDRLRLNAAHELGHLVMRSTGDAKKDETFAFRFAASFIVPAEAARRELGPSRSRLALDELGLLKQRWGLSMQGWIRRAYDLEIIKHDLYRKMNVRFRKANWHRSEPFPYRASESPALFQRLVHRALAERMITRNDANKLFPDSVRIGEQLSSADVSLRELALRPREERHRVLQDFAFALDRADVEHWRETSSDRSE